MNKQISISDLKLEDKTASNLVQFHMIDDSYHNNIVDCATKLVLDGNGRSRYEAKVTHRPDQWVYHTQYASGSCCFRTTDNEYGTIIHLD